MHQRIYAHPSHWGAKDYLQTQHWGVHENVHQRGSSNNAMNWSTFGALQFPATTRATSIPFTPNAQNAVDDYLGSQWPMLAVNSTLQLDFFDTPLYISRIYIWAATNAPSSGQLTCTITGLKVDGDSEEIGYMYNHPLPPFSIPHMLNPIDVKPNQYKSLLFNCNRFGAPAGIFDIRHQ